MYLCVLVCLEIKLYIRELTQTTVEAIKLEIYMSGWQVGNSGKSEC